MQHFNLRHDTESAIELTYHYNVTRNIYIQPDFQYIINPMGTLQNLDNSFASLFRFGLVF